MSVQSHKGALGWSGRRRGGYGGATDTHGEYYDALPRSRPRTRAEQMEIDLSSAYEKIKKMEVDQRSMREKTELLRWLLDTYDFDADAVERIGLALEDNG